MFSNTTRAALLLTLLSGACTGEAADAAPYAELAEENAEAPSVEPTGTVVEVRMITDGEGNVFEPAKVEARRGDLIRFVLVSGVHNVSFPGDLNPGAGELPEAGPYLQLPGQTWDLLVEVAPGEYGFQCDPHAALGMVGTLTVTP